MSEPPIRPHVVEALLDVDFTRPLSEAETARVHGATTDELRAVAAHHEREADRLNREAFAGLDWISAQRYIMKMSDQHRALHGVMSLLWRWWFQGRRLGQFTMNDALKVAPVEVVRQVHALLAEAGFTAEELGLPPLPDDAADDDGPPRSE